MDEILIQLIQFVKNASPLVWQALIKQAYIDGIGAVILAVILTTVGFDVVGFARAAKEVESEDNAVHKTYSFTFFLSIVASALFAFAGCAISWGVRTIINPEFYVIEYVLKNLGGK